MNKLKHNYWFKSGFFTISQRLSTPLFGLVSFLILIRNLTEEQMGVWALFLIIVTILEVCRNGLIKAAIVKFYNEAKDQGLQIKTSALVINILYTAFSFFFLAVFADTMSQQLNSPGLDQMILAYGISALFMIPFSHLEYIQQSNMSFQGVFFSYFFKQGIFLLLIVITVLVLRQGLSLVQLVLYQAIGIAFGAIISLLFSKKYLDFKFSWSQDWVSRLWAFGKFGFFTNVSNSGLTATDHFLLGGLISAPTVAVYNASARITNVFIIPSVAIADILYPKSVQAKGEKGVQGVKNLYEQAVGATLVPMLPIFIFLQLFPEFVVKTLAGENYLDAAPILRIASIGIFLLPFLKQFGTVVNTMNKPQHNFYFVTSLAVFNIVLNYILINQFGIIGAASGTVCSYFIGVIVSQIILNKMANISMLNVFRAFVKFYKMIFTLKLRNV